MLKSACICLESLTFSLAANANVLTFTDCFRIQFIRELEHVLKHHQCHQFMNTSSNNCSHFVIWVCYWHFVFRVCRCKGASHYGLSADRKRRSQEGECTDSTSELTIATLPNDGPTSAAVALLSDEPGLVNPAFDPSMEDNSQSGSTTSLAARSSTKKSECEWANRCLCVLMFNAIWRYLARERAKKVSVCHSDRLKTNRVQRSPVTVTRSAVKTKHQRSVFIHIFTPADDMTHNTSFTNL